MPQRNQTIPAVPATSHSPASEYQKTTRSLSTSAASRKQGDAKITAAPAGAELEGARGNAEEFNRSSVSSRLCGLADRSETGPTTQSGVLPSDQREERAVRPIESDEMSHLAPPRTVPTLFGGNPQHVETYPGIDIGDIETSPCGKWQHQPLSGQKNPRTMRSPINLEAQHMQNDGSSKESKTPIRTDFKSNTEPATSFRSERSRGQRMSLSSLGASPPTNGSRSSIFRSKGKPVSAARPSHRTSDRVVPRFSSSHSRHSNRSRESRRHRSSTRDTQIVWTEHDEQLSLMVHPGKLPIRSRSAVHYGSSLAPLPRKPPSSVKVKEAECNSMLNEPMVDELDVNDKPSHARTERIVAHKERDGYHGLPRLSNTRFSSSSRQPRSGCGTAPTVSSSSPASSQGSTQGSFCTPLSQGSSLGSFRTPSNCSSSRNEDYRIDDFSSTSEDIEGDSSKVNEEGHIGRKGGLELEKRVSSVVMQDTAESKDGNACDRDSDEFIHEEDVSVEAVRMTGPFDCNREEEEAYKGKGIKGQEVELDGVKAELFCDHILCSEKMSVGSSANEMTIKNETDKSHREKAVEISVASNIAEEGEDGCVRFVAPVAKDEFCASATADSANEEGGKEIVATQSMANSAGALHADPASVSVDAERKTMDKDHDAPARPETWSTNNRPHSATGVSEVPLSPSLKETRIASLKERFESPSRAAAAISSLILQYESTLDDDKCEENESTLQDDATNSTDAQAKEPADLRNFIVQPVSVSEEATEKGKKFETNEVLVSKETIAKQDCCVHEGLNDGSADGATVNDAPNVDPSASISDKFMGAGFKEKNSDPRLDPSQSAYQTDTSPNLPIALKHPLVLDESNRGNPRNVFGVRSPLSNTANGYSSEETTTVNNLSSHGSFVFKSGESDDMYKRVMTRTNHMGPEAESGVDSESESRFQGPERCFMQTRPTGKVSKKLLGEGKKAQKIAQGPNTREITLEMLSTVAAAAGESWMDATNSTATTASSEWTEESNVSVGGLVPISSLDNEVGMVHGDCLISILYSAAKQKKKILGTRKGSHNKKGELALSDDESTEHNDQLSCRAVQDAVWRMRRVRRYWGGEPHATLSGGTPMPATAGVSNAALVASRNIVASSELSNDAANYPAQVRCQMATLNRYGEEIQEDGSSHVKSLEKSAIEYLKNDDFDGALLLMDEIQSFYEEKLLQVSRAQDGGTISHHSQLKPHPYIGIVLHNKGIINLLNGDYENAMQNFQKAMKTRKLCLGEHSIDHVASLIKFGVSCYALGKHSLAENTFKEALPLIPAVGWGVVFESEIWNNLACIEFESGFFVNPLQLFKKSLELLSKALHESVCGGLECSTSSLVTGVATIRCNIGYIQLKREKSDTAIQCFVDSLVQQQLVMHPNDPTVMQTMDNLALANLQKGERQKALKVYSRMLQLQIETFGPHHIQVAQTMRKISLVEVKSQNYERALNYFEQINEAGAKNKDPRLANRFQKLMGVGKHEPNTISKLKSAARSLSPMKSR